MKVLVLSALESTWGTDEDIFFLGEWCCLYNRKRVWSKRKYSIQEYHWKDRDKFLTDAKYLEIFIEEVLCVLSKYLSDKHNVCYSKKAWRIILGPWLVYMIPLLWDKWESIRIALSTHKYKSINLIDSSDSFKIPNDYNEFTKLLNNHLWSNSIFQDILLYLEVGNIKICCNSNGNSNSSSNSNSIIKKRLVTNKKTLLNMTLLNLFNKVIGLIPFHEKIYFHTPGMSLSRYTILSLSLKQLPVLHHLEFDKIYSKINSETSLIDSARQHSLTSGKSKDFENFVYSHLLSYIPFSYFEKFKKIEENIHKIDFSGDVVFTSTSYFSDDFFKFWAANQVDNGVRLLVSEHGSSIIPRYSIFQHDDKISDKKITWSIPYRDNHVQLSPNKINQFSKKTSIGKKLTIVSLEFPLYAYSCRSGPVSSMILDDYNQKTVFIDRLNRRVYDELSIRPYPSYKTGWQVKYRYIGRYGYEKISVNKNLLNDIQDSKIVVCTYPETTFSESMASGTPTILLYLDWSWEPNFEFYDLLNELRDQKIIFSDPIKAAEHINYIWSNPLAWWNSSSVVISRNLFSNMCCKTNIDWVKEWSDFLKGELADEKNK